MNGNGARDAETDEAWEDVNAVDAILLDVEKEAEEWRREQAELRHMLGVDDASGYHVVDEDTPDALDDGAVARQARQGRRPSAPVAAGEPDDHVQGRRPGRLFPCLEGGRYTGCLGMACPLETCWTGAATISFAHKVREGAGTRVSTALYLPGAPCHTCARLHEDVAPARPPSGRRPPGRAEQPDAGVEDEETSAPSRRITCARGLWAHSISLASFVTGRIPMRDQDAPEQCPGFVERAAPHPAVAAHLQRRRERTRRLREERRAGDG